MKLKLIPAAHELIPDMRAFFQISDAKLNQQVADRQFLPDRRTYSNC